MVIRVELKKCSMDQQQFIYKVDNLYLETLLSSLVLLNTRVYLSHNNKSLVEITREPNKKSLMYFYTIYTIITSPILNYIYYL